MCERAQATLQGFHALFSVLVAAFDEWVRHARAHVRRLETQVMPAVLQEAVAEPGEDA